MAVLALSPATSIDSDPGDVLLGMKRGESTFEDHPRGFETFAAERLERDLNTSFEVSSSGDDEQENEQDHEATKEIVDDDDDSESVSSLSSVSSEEWRPKSKQRPWLPPSLARKEAAGMTFDEMREAMDASLIDEPYDRSNWKPPKSIMEIVAKRQRKERRAARREARIAGRNGAHHQELDKKAGVRWKPY